MKLKKYWKKRVQKMEKEKEVMEQIDGIAALFFIVVFIIIMSLAS